MFATPIAYLIDESGAIARNVAVGIDGILDLMPRAERVRDEVREAAQSPSPPHTELTPVATGGE
jgi:hypothetical protein